MGLSVAVIGFSTPVQANWFGSSSQPNIIYILADDMGQGDTTVYNTDSKISTPHLQRLADEGMTFTNMHTNSSVCTPTRYGVITGRYAWRTRSKNWIGKAWIYGLLVVITFFSLAFYPFTNNY